MHPGQAKCGAKTRKGTPCADIAMANGRCKRHGGKSTGAKDVSKLTGSVNGAYTHGIYTKFMRDDEKALIDSGALRAGNVDAELEVVRLRLKRTLEAKDRWEAEVRGEIDGSDAETSLALEEVVEGEAIGPEGAVIPVRKETKRRPDFEKIMDACLARIESLEKTRKELMKDPEGDEVPGDGPTRDRVTFTGGLDGGSDEELPSPFEKPGKP